MQAAHVKEVNKRLLKLKDIMAKGGKCSTRGFIHLCLIPRLQRSAEDAMFCARFIQCMHEIDMPGFQTLNVVKGVNSIWLLLPSPSSFLHQPTLNQFIVLEDPSTFLTKLSNQKHVPANISLPLLFPYSSWDYDLFFQSTLRISSHFCSSHSRGVTRCSLI